MNVDICLLDDHLSYYAGKAVILIDLFVGLRFWMLRNVVADVGWFFDKSALFFGFFLVNALIKKDQLGLLRKLVAALDEGGEQCTLC